jgi:hypothetical protein
MRQNAILLVCILTLFACQRDLSQFDYLLTPEISVKPSQKMLVVEVKGDPNTAGKEAFGQLFKSFYALKKEYRTIKMAPPRARWPFAFNELQEEWIGKYALPLPNEIEQLPQSEKISPNVRLETWYGGEVAEILHLGPYGEETPTIEKLMAFIEAQGYQISSDHEEEYLKGPGMFSKGNPKKYRTIIRYEVTPKD